MDEQTTVRAGYDAIAARYLLKARKEDKL